MELFEAKSNSAGNTVDKIKKLSKVKSGKNKGESSKDKGNKATGNNSDNGSGLGEKIKKVHRPFGNSIKSKLITAFFIPVLFIVLLGISAYHTSSKTIVNSFRQSAENVINSTANYYNVILENVKSTAISLSVDGSIKNYFSGRLAEDKLYESSVYKELRNRIATQAIADKYIENISIIAEYGSPISSKGSLVDTNPYQDFIATEEGSNISNDTWTGYHNFIDQKLKLSTKDYAIAYTKPLYDVALKPIGFIFLDLSMGIVTDALTSINLPDNSTAAFISPDGRELYANSAEMKEVQEPIFVNESFYTEAFSREEKNGTFDVKYAGKDHLFIYSKIGDTGSMVVALVPADELTKNADTIKFMTICIVLVASVIAGIIGVVTASGIGKNIRSIIGTLNKAADGDLTVKVQTKRKDEFHTLSESINHMISNMKALIAKASNVGATVIKSSQNMSQGSELLLTASKDISKAISEIQQGIIQQASDAERCLHQTDALAQQINMVYENSMAIEKITSGTRDVVVDGITMVDQLNQATKASIEITNDTIKEIEELDAESRSITEIIAVINDIAEQTNLLSLNASIEAARAGDAGRGFSVVADEIRKLSVKSVTSASDIEKIITSINKKTEHTVKTVKKAEEISKTTEERLQQVVELFNNINLHVDDLAEKMSRIADNISDIDKAKNDTLHAIESISAVAEETTAASEEVDATAQQQLEAVMKLNDSAKELDKDASDLEASIRLFKVE